MSVLVVLIMMLDTVMITSIDDEHVVINIIGCCFGEDGNGLCDERHDLRNWLVTPKPKKKILRTVLSLILTTFSLMHTG